MHADRGVLSGFHVQAVGLASLEIVDTALLVHGQQPVAACADAGEPDVPISVEDGGRGLLAGPGVDVLVGSEGRLPMAAGCGLQVVEPFGSLGRESNLFWCAVLCPNVDVAVAGQADKLAVCRVDARVVGLLLVGRSEGQAGAGGGFVVRAQSPVRGLGPTGGQRRVLQDGGLEIEGLAIKRPPVEPGALTLRVLLRRCGDGEGSGVLVVLLGRVAEVPSATRGFDDPPPPRSA